MTIWSAVSSGALDVRGHDLSSSGFDLILTPSAPGSPRFLWAQGAKLWLELSEREIDDDALDEDHRRTLAELEDLGLAVRDKLCGASSVATRPWLLSFQHELVYALLARVAASLSIRIVFIKGPTLHAQGLRTREHSGDVDCWVEPGQDARLGEAMREWGWTPLYSAFQGTAMSHSLTLAPGDWGCAVDVHTRFPGSNLSASESFEFVYSFAEPRVFAGVTCLTPVPAVHAVIFALHELRPYLGRQAAEPQKARAVMALEAAGEQTVDIANSLRAGYVLEGVLRSAFPALDINITDRNRPLDWDWRLTESAPRRHLKALLGVPWRNRVRVAFRLVWPDVEMTRRLQKTENQLEVGPVLMRVQRLFHAGTGLLRRRSPTCQG